MLEAEKVRGGGGRTVKKQLANGLTVGRMICAALLLGTAPFSAAFYVLYTLCGLTDLLDGPVARRTGSAGAFGARLDSAADLMFVLAAAVRCGPVLWALLPRWVFAAAGVSALMRLAAWLLGAVKFRCPVARHTVLNKAAGAVLFAAGYLVGWRSGLTAAAAACALALLSAGEELWLCVRSARFDPDEKGVCFARAPHEEEN